MKIKDVVLLPLFLFAFSSSAWAVSLGKELCKNNFDLYRDRLEKNPVDEQAWNELRVCTTELKRWNDAADISSTALQKNPKIAEAHLLLGITQLHSKDYTHALEEFKQAAELKDNMPTAFYYVGMANLFLNQPAAAAEAASKAVTLDPKNPSYHSQLAYADFLLEDNDRAEAAAKKAIELDPNNIAAYKVLGNIYKREGRQAESDKAFEEGMHANGREAATNPFTPDKKTAAPAVIAALPGMAVPSPGAAKSAPMPAERSQPVEPAPEPVDHATACRNTWQHMKDAVAANNFPKALSYFSDYAETREQYRKAFERLGPKVKGMLDNIGELEDCDVVMLVATCKAPIRAGAGTMMETAIHFERNDDKVWRIKSF